MTRAGKQRILIKNALLVATMDEAQPEFRGGHILIENGRIVSLGPNVLEVPAEEVVDATGMVVLPGFINTHHHFFQTLTRNLPAMQDVPLFPWLKRHYEVWRELTTEAIYVSARTALLELMYSGVTASTDHLYLFPRQAEKTLIDEEIRAARELGIRFHPTRGSMSLGQSQGGLPPDDVVQTEEEIRRDTERLLAQYHDSAPGAMVQIALAPCSPFSVTPELMRQVAQLAGERGLRMHTHLAETLDEEQFCLENFGARPVAYMQQLGWLEEYAWFAHCVHLSDEEIRLMGDKRVGVAHCPSSNMRLGSGIAPVKKLLQAGAKVGIGVDGSASNDSSDMLLEMRQALLLSRLRPEGEWLTAREVFWMATRGGAAILGRDDLGRLAPGACADLALFSLSGLGQAGAQSDPLAALLFTTRQRPVDYLIINGEIRLRPGINPFPEEQWIKRHNELAAELVRRAQERTGFDFLAHDER